MAEQSLYERIMALAAQYPPLPQYPDKPTIIACQEHSAVPIDRVPGDEDRAVGMMHVVYPGADIRTLECGCVLALPRRMTEEEMDAATLAHMEGRIQEELQQIVWRDPLRPTLIRGGGD